MRLDKYLARYLCPPLSPSRLDRQWRSIARRLGRLRVEARKLQALGVPGDIVRCVGARDGYRGRIPHGIHAALIRKRCGSN